MSPEAFKRTTEDIERVERRRQIAERSAGGRKPCECRCTFTPTSPESLAATAALFKVPPRVAEAIDKAVQGPPFHTHSNDLLFCRWDPETNTIVWDE